MSLPSPDPERSLPRQTGAVERTAEDRRLLISVGGDLSRSFSRGAVLAPQPQSASFVAIQLIALFGFDALKAAARLERDAATYNDQKDIDHSELLLSLDDPTLPVSVALLRAVRLNALLKNQLRGETLQTLERFIADRGLWIPIFAMTGAQELRSETLLKRLDQSFAEWIQDENADGLCHLALHLVARMMRTAETHSQQAQVKELLRCFGRTLEANGRRAETRYVKRLLQLDGLTAPPLESFILAGRAASLDAPKIMRGELTARPSADLYRRIPRFAKLLVEEFGNSGIGAAALLLDLHHPPPSDELKRRIQGRLFDTEQPFEERALSALVLGAGNSAENALVLLRGDTLEEQYLGAIILQQCAKSDPSLLLGVAQSARESDRVRCWGMYLAAACRAIRSENDQASIISAAEGSEELEQELYAARNEGLFGEPLPLVVASGVLEDAPPWRSWLEE